MTRNKESAVYSYPTRIDSMQMQEINQKEEDMNREKKKRKRNRGKREKKSLELCLGAPRRPFVRCHRFELAGGTNSAFRRSTSNASAAAIAIYGVCCMSCVVVYVVCNPSKGKNIHLIRRVGCAGSKKKKFRVGFAGSK